MVSIITKHGLVRVSDWWYCFVHVTDSSIGLLLILLHVHLLRPTSVDDERFNYSSRDSRNAHTRT